jgi:hypothetical protein
VQGEILSTIQVIRQAAHLCGHSKVSLENAALLKQVLFKIRSEVKKLFPNEVNSVNRVLLDNSSAESPAFYSHSATINQEVAEIRSSSLQSSCLQSRALALPPSPYAPPAPSPSPRSWFAHNLRFPGEVTSLEDIAVNR